MSFREERGINFLTKNFVKSGNIVYVSELHLICLRVEDPKLLSIVLNGPDVGVRAQENVLQLRLLLVNLFDSLCVSCRHIRILTFCLLETRIFFKL